MYGGGSRFFGFVAGNRRGGAFRENPAGFANLVPAATAWIGWRIVSDSQVPDDDRCQGRGGAVAAGRGAVDAIGTVFAQHQFG